MTISPALMPLRARFIALNEARADQLAKHQISLLTEDHAPEALMAAGAIAHQICGVAQTLGFDDLGKLSFKLDQTVAAFRNNQSDYQTAWLEAEELIEELIVAITRSAA